MSAAPVPAEAPALGFSIVANLGDNRQITCQCFVNVDEDLPEIHARIDKVQSVIDRQRARYEVADIEKERDTAAKTLQRAKDDLATVEGNFKSTMAENDQRLIDIAAQIADINKAAADRGRGSPAGADASRVRALEAQRKEIVAAKDKNNAERDQYLQNVLVSIERFEEAVADCDRRLEAAHALIEGG